MDNGRGLADVVDFSDVELEPHPVPSFPRCATLNKPHSRPEEPNRKPGPSIHRCSFTLRVDRSGLADSKPHDGKQHNANSLPPLL